MTDYITVDDKPVPTAVSDEFDSIGNWERLNPTNVETYQTLIGTVYEGIVDGTEQYVTDSGWSSNINRYDYVTLYQDGALPSTEIFESPFAYRDDVDVIHHDHYGEHVTRVIAVTQNGRISFGSRSGICWFEPVRSRKGIEPTRDVLHLVGSMLDAENDIERPDGYEKAVGGWHSSMERSEQSELFNALSKGDVPSHMAESAYPYVVRYGDTRNCCTVNASIYGNTEFREMVQKAFDGTRARPICAGFK